jgi:hypothetical protein
MPPQWSGAAIREDAAGTRVRGPAPGRRGQRGNPFQRLSHLGRRIGKLDLDRFDLQPDGAEKLADACMQIPAEPLALQFDLVSRTAPSPTAPGLPGEAALRHFQTKIVPNQVVLQGEQAISMV